jgi:hypothetical protein
VLYAGTDVIVLGSEEDLGLVPEPAKGIGMNNRRGIPEVVSPKILLPGFLASGQLAVVEAVFKVHGYYYTIAASEKREKPHFGLI